MGHIHVYVKRLDIIGSDNGLAPVSLDNPTLHYDDVIMGTIAFQITSLTIVCSTVYSGADQRKHQSSASLAFVWGIHRRPVNSPHKWPITRKMFPFDDVIMDSLFIGHLNQCSKTFLSQQCIHSCRVRNGNHFIQAWKHMINKWCLVYLTNTHSNGRDYLSMLGYTMLFKGPHVFVVCVGFYDHGWFWSNIGMFGYFNRLFRRTEFI